MTVVRMTNPLAYHLPAVRRLFLASVAGTTNQEYVAAKPAGFAADPRFAIYIGIEHGEPLALALVRLPADSRAEEPMLDMFTNLGSHAIGTEVLSHALAFVRASGYTKLWTINLTGRPDAVWLRNAQRRTREFGISVKHKMTVFEFDVTPEGKDPANGRE